MDRSLPGLLHVVTVPQSLRQDSAPGVQRPEQPPATPQLAVDGPRWLAACRVQALLLLVAPMLLLVMARFFFAPTDPDYWWHARTGQYVVESGTLPRVDIYSYTVPGRPWVTHEWLTEVLMHVVQQQFGYVGNVALFGSVSALTALAVYATCRLRGLGEPAAAMLMLWAIGIGMGSANVRPQLLTTLLLAVCSLLLTLYLRGQTRALWPFPLLLALWVNLHGGYVIGLVFLGLTIVGQVITLAMGRTSPPLGPLILTTFLAAVATLLSPHGFDAILYPFSYLGSENAMMRFILEWQSANFHQSGVLVFAASLLLAVLLGVGRRPLGPTEVLWTLVLALMALQSVRHIALYGVLVTPLLGARLQAEVPMLRCTLASWRRPMLLAVIWPLVGLVLIRVALSEGAWERAQLGREPVGATFPVGAVQYVRTHDLHGNLFNAYHWGGYLIYHLFPERRVFIDGRTDVYAELVGRYHEVVTLQPNWRHILDEHDVRLVLVEKDSPLAVVLGNDPGWQTAFTTDVEQLFVRH